MVLADVLAGLTTGAVEFLPNLVAAIILLVIGLVVGKVVGRVVWEILTKMKVDYYVHETHKPVVSLAALFSVVGRWWIYLAFAAAALSPEVLGITELARWITQINAFIPRIIGASLILVTGYASGEYIKGHIKNTNTLWGVLTGKVLCFFILYVSIALALPILIPNAELIGQVLLVIIGSVGLGLAIAIGLGMKEAVGDVSTRYVKKLKV